MAEAGHTLFERANNKIATVEQRHFVACALNTHASCGPTIKVRVLAYLKCRL